MPSISSPHGSKQAVQFVPRGFTPALTQIRSQSIPTPLPHQRKTSTQRMGIKIALEQSLFPLYLVVCLEIQ